ncbi:MAG TPA: hypothetical protein VGV07_02700 [Devosia sp.]|jgi:hypothetical protein|uniref:hypothetical protein n=1 Tax=Devosia sp. TaxID=1871048 RepID=UPI002DDD072C|nr:hypothetical protein [Devosia sp.]HEV2514134.1 hypothetical protein [Devosia sp.]
MKTFRGAIRGQIFAEVGDRIAGSITASKSRAFAKFSGVVTEVQAAAGNGKLPASPDAAAPQANAALRQLRSGRSLTLARLAYPAE